MNQVFNTQYVPEINHDDLNLNDLENIKTSKHLFDTANKKNKSYYNDFNASKRTNATKCSHN